MSFNKWLEFMNVCNKAHLTRQGLEGNSFLLGLD